MSYLTDRKRVMGHGSAKDGTGHFIHQRLTAIALVPLTILFVLPFAYNLGAGYDRVIEAYSHPVNAIVAILFIFTVFTHLRLGLQVVIEDYVHGHGAHNALLIANTLFCWLFGLIGVFAIAKIAL